jgi:hypothetical protein
LPTDEPVEIWTLAGQGGLTLRFSYSTAGSRQYPVLSTSNSSNPANIPALTGLRTTDRAFAAQLTNDVTGTIGSITQDFYLSSRTGFIPYQQSYEPMRKTESA